MGHTGTGPHGSSNDQFGLPHWPDDSIPIPVTCQCDTMTIIVDNSDNRLAQNIWAHYCAFLQQVIEDNVFRIRFFGGSA